MCKFIPVPWTGLRRDGLDRCRLLAPVASSQKRGRTGFPLTHQDLVVFCACDCRSVCLLSSVVKEEAHVHDDPSLTFKIVDFFVLRTCHLFMCHAFFLTFSHMYYGLLFLKFYASIVFSILKCMLNFKSMKCKSDILYRRIPVTVL